MLRGRASTFAHFLCVVAFVVGLRDVRAQTPTPSPLPSNIALPPLACPQKRVTAYVPSVYTCYRPLGFRFEPNSLDANLVTHAVYTFATFNTSEPYNVHETNPQLPDGPFMRSFVEHIRSSPSCAKPIIAIGGGSYNQATTTSRAWLDLASAPASQRSAFAQSAVQFARSHGFEGLELYWDFKRLVTEDVTSEEKDNLTALVAALRASIDSDASDRGSAPLELIVSVNPHPQVMDLLFDFMAWEDHVDSITILTVDLRLPWESATAFHSPLYNPSFPLGGPMSGSISQSIESALSQGIAPTILSLAIAGYGRTWKLDPSVELGCNPDLGAGTLATGPAPAGLVCGRPGFLPYVEVASLCQVNVTDFSCSTLWAPAGCLFQSIEEVAAFGIFGDYWVGLDTPDTVAMKGAYVWELGIGGAAFVTADMDQFRGGFPLLARLSHSLRERPSPSSTPAPTPSSSQSPSSTASTSFTSTATHTASASPTISVTATNSPPPNSVFWVNIVMVFTAEEEVSTSISVANSSFILAKVGSLLSNTDPGSFGDVVWGGINSAGQAELLVSPSSSPVPQPSNSPSPSPSPPSTVTASATATATAPVTTPTTGNATTTTDEPTIRGLQANGADNEANTTHVYRMVVHVQNVGNSRADAIQAAVSSAAFVNTMYATLSTVFRTELNNLVPYADIVRVAPSPSPAPAASKVALLVFQDSDGFDPTSSGALVGVSLLGVIIMSGGVFAGFKLYQKAKEQRRMKQLRHEKLKKDALTWRVHVGMEVSEDSEDSDPGNDAAAPAKKLSKKQRAARRLKLLRNEEMLRTLAQAAVEDEEVRTAELVPSAAQAVGSSTRGSGASEGQPSGDRAPVDSLPYPVLPRLAVRSSDEVGLPFGTSADSQPPSSPAGTAISRSPLRRPLTSRISQGAAASRDSVGVPLGSPPSMLQAASTGQTSLGLRGFDNEAQATPVQLPPRHATLSPAQQFQLSCLKSSSNSTLAAGGAPGGLVGTSARALHSAQTRTILSLPRTMATVTSTSEPDIPACFTSSPYE